jgi:hypothetical protein
MGRSRPKTEGVVELMPTIMAVEADWNRRCCSGIGFLTNQ